MITTSCSTFCSFLLSANIDSANPRKPPLRYTTPPLRYTPPKSISCQVVTIKDVHQPIYSVEINLFQLIVPVPSGILSSMASSIFLGIPISRWSLPKTLCRFAAISRSLKQALKYPTSSNTPIRFRDISRFWLSSLNHSKAMSTPSIASRATSPERKINQDNRASIVSVSSSSATYDSNPSNNAV